MFAAIVGQSWADDAHPYNLEVNGVDHIASLRDGSLRIEMAGPGSNGSMSFSLWDPTLAISISEWDEVRFIEHAATRPLLFGGFVQSVRYTAIKGNAGRFITLQCVGYGILLDRKVCTETTLPFDVDVDAQVQRLVSMFGGLVTAQRGAAYAAIDATFGIPRYEDLTGGGRWLLDYFTGASDPVISGPTTLRSAVEYLLGIALAEADWLADLSVVPVPGIFWIDSARMFRLLPNGSASTSTRWQSGGSDYEGQWDSGSTGFAFDLVGSHAVEELEYEREDTDRVTSAYVEGGNALGSGFVRLTGMSRAGDLETIVSDSTSVAVADIAPKGIGAVGRTTTATARGSITVSSDTPLALWPGRAISVDAAAVGLGSSQKWMATSVSIHFRTTTNRVYEVGFGGSVPAPSIARRQGRFAYRR